MARPSNGSNIYLQKLTEIKDFFLPQGERLKAAVSAILRGSSIALSLVAGFTAFLSLGMFLSKSVYGPSALRAALSLTLSGFGSIVDFSGGGVFSTQGSTNSAFAVGLHAGLITLISFWVIWLVSKRYSSKNEVSAATPIYVAFGFTVFSWVLGLIAQGVVDFELGYASVKPMSFTAFLLVFTFVWTASSRAQISTNFEKSSGINQAFYWIGRALSNFVLIYTALVVIGLIVFGIRNLIEPHFALASMPLEPSTATLSVEQQTLAIYGILLFAANAFFQALFVAMGVNFGTEFQGLGSGLDFSAVPGFSSAPQGVWIYDSLGAPAFIGVSLLVVVVALISGAAASARTGIQFKTTKAYWQVLGFGLLLSGGLAYLTSLQVSIDQASGDGKNTSTLWIFYGSYMLSIFALATIVISAAFLASEKAFAFIASGFPNLVLRLQAAPALERRESGGRAFGVLVKLVIVAVIATPITASTINRVSALTDGPTQLGQRIATDIQTMKLQDLKVQFNPTGSRAHQWLSDKILTKAQPKTGYQVSIKTLNKLGNDWQPGNLDAKVTVQLSKSGKSFNYTFDTTSKIKHPSWLLTHVDYSPKLSPATLTIQVNPQLGKDLLKSLTVNGEAVKPGAYYSVPGEYSVKATGLKLIAPTNRKFYASTDSTIKVGYEVSLPDGASESLDKSILSKAQDCFKISSSGSSTCINANDLNATIVSGSEPSDYFDSSDSDFRSTGVSCSSKRSDILSSSTAEISKKSCSATVTFTRNYYKVFNKQVPTYDTRTVCSGSHYVDYNGNPVSYDPWSGYWVNNYGQYFYSYSIHIDSCYYQSTESYQTGYETVSVRGSKIGSTKMTANAEKTLSVTGTLNANGSFSVKK